MGTIRILFVDDEPDIRQTLPAILERKGFRVWAAATVGEALREMSAQEFDVLISDLNIGEPGDGFTVVSAMRRLQPRCRNIILTGYPGFDSALQAIRNQVDDYLIKPTSVESLVLAIGKAIAEDRPHRPVPFRPIPRILRDSVDEIARRTLEAMKAHPELGALPVSDHDRIDHLPRLVHALADELESAGNTQRAEPRPRASEHGRLRFCQGYSIANIVDDTRLLKTAIYDVVQANLLALNLSNLLPDLKRINHVLDEQLKDSLLGYVEQAQAAT